MFEQLNKIRQAYDLTVEYFNNRIDPMVNVPAEFKSSAKFKAFQEDSDDCNSGADDIREFLKPEAGMNFLDMGCCANLVNYQLYNWPSKYYGIDISGSLINEMNLFVQRQGLNIGGLYVGEVSNLPFEDVFFDIATMIGVMEYWELDYIKSALEELNRVLKTEARLVVDLPNLDSQHCQTMFELEEYLNRPNVEKPRKDFENILLQYFNADDVNDKHVMIKYFVKAK